MVELGYKMKRENKEKEKGFWKTKEEKKRGQNMKIIKSYLEEKKEIVTKKERKRMKRVRKSVVVCARVYVCVLQQ